MILDHEHLTAAQDIRRSRANRQVSGSSISRCRSLGFTLERQSNRERRTSPLPCTVRRDSSSMELDDVPNDGEAETQPTRAARRL